MKITGEVMINTIQIRSVHRLFQEIPTVFSVFRPFIFSTNFSVNSDPRSSVSVSMCSTPTPMSGDVTSSSVAVVTLAVSSSDGELVSLVSVV